MMRRLALALVVLAAGVLVGGELVEADAPVADAWFTRAHDLVPATLDTTLPPPPTVDPGELFVAWGNGQQEAVAALRFEVPEGADASLALVAEDQRPLTLPPGGFVDACVAFSSWEPGGNQRWADAPGWGACITGTPTASADGVFWFLTADMQAEPGVYDLVIVPKGTAPFSLTFETPGATTLIPDEGTTTTTTEETTTTTEETTTTTTAFVGDSGGGATSGGVRSLPPSASAPPTAPSTSLVAIQLPSSTPRTPFRIPDSRGERMMAVALLFAMAAVLWWLGGSPTRGPRMIGALADRTPGNPAAPAPLLRGVGRFARARGGRPPRL